MSKKLEEIMNVAKDLSLKERAELAGTLLLSLDEPSDNVKIERLDHLVLTVCDIEATVSFYVRVLGMKPVTFGDGRRALSFGQQKLNLHPAEAPIEPHAAHPTVGSADLCFITSSPISGMVAHLKRNGIPIEEGPVSRTGALGPMTSIYFRDPDGNLVEVSCYG